MASHVPAPSEVMLQVVLYMAAAAGAAAAGSAAAWHTTRKPVKVAAQHRAVKEAPHEGVLVLR